jgi:hypothetical protein
MNRSDKGVRLRIGRPIQARSARVNLLAINTLVRFAALDVFRAEGPFLCLAQPIGLG